MYCDLFDYLIMVGLVTLHALLVMLPITDPVGNVKMNMSMKYSLDSLEINCLRVNTVEFLIHLKWATQTIHR